MYLNTCTAYGVDENLFEQDNTTITKTAGIIINNSGTDDNLIYRNSFQNVKLGSIAMDENGSIDPVSGLVFKCGDYATSWVDIGVLDGIEPGTINPNQGECLTNADPEYITAPANNLFTDPSNVISDGQFFTDNDVNDILYVFFEDDDESTAPFARPKEYSSPVDPYPAGGINSGCSTTPFDNEDWATEYCPTHFTSGGGERLANPGFTKSLINSKHNNSSALYRKEGDSIEEIEDEWDLNIMLHAQLRYFMSGDMQDSILMLLDGNESPLANAVLSAIAADNNDFESAQSFITALENEEAIKQGYSSELQEISLQLIQDTLSWLNLDSAQLETVKTLAEENDHTGIKSQHILCYLNDNKYQEVIPVIDPEQEEIAKTVQSLHSRNSNTISIYPNPIRNYGIIQINISENVPDAKMFITGIAGKVVKTFILKPGINYIELNNKMLYPGAYIGYVKGNGIENLTKQFIVIQ